VVAILLNPPIRILLLGAGKRSIDARSAYVEDL